MQTVIKKITRLKNTPEGNPRWKIETTNGAFWTKPNAMLGHMVVLSWEGRVVECSIQSQYITDIQLIGGDHP